MSVSLKTMCLSVIVCLSQPLLLPTSSCLASRRQFEIGHIKRIQGIVLNKGAHWKTSLYTPSKRPKQFAIRESYSTTSFALWSEKETTYVISDGEGMIQDFHHKTTCFANAFVINLLYTPLISLIAKLLVIPSVALKTRVHLKAA